MSIDNISLKQLQSELSEAHLFFCHGRDRQEYSQIEALTGIRLPIGIEVVKQWKI